MEVLTLHGYSHASDEAPTSDGSAIPCKAASLHLSLLSLEDRPSSHVSFSANEAPLTDGTAALVQSFQHSCQGSQCIDEASMAGATVHQSNFLNKNFMNPIQLGWAVEGNMFGEYFGLAVAVCAVGLLRSACLGSEATNTKFLREDTPSMVGKNSLARVDLLMQRSSAEKKQGRESQVASGTAEQSILLQKINRLQGELLEVKRLRSEDGKANERVVSIFASKEQAWNAEKRKFRDDQQMLCQELQRAYFNQEALNLKFEQQLRSLQKQPCLECEHREGLFAELKERFGEQEFLIMATMEETQIEQQEKNVLAEKLASAESSLSQMEQKFFLEAENHAIELQKHKELVEQLQMNLKEGEIEHSQIYQELRATRASLSTLVHEKCCSDEHVEKLSMEIAQLKQAVQGKDDIVSVMLKKAKADNEDRKELEKEVAVLKAKLCHAEIEKEKLRRHMELSTRSSKTENLRFRNSFGSTSVLNNKDMIEEMQKLHDVEIRNLQSTYEEQVQMLQRRLGLYQERVADLEEDILLRMTHASHMITNKQVDSSSHEELTDNKYMVVLKESLEAELATKQFQLSVAKTLIKQFMDLEVHREQEVENWKKLYLASKTNIGSRKEREQAGAVVPKKPDLPDQLELGKSRYTYKLEQRQWQLIDAFERQMKARDERMEAFRCQLLHMKGEMQRSHQQVEALKQSLANANEEKWRLEELLQQEKNKVLACQDNSLGRYTKCTCEENHQEGVCSLWEKVSAFPALLAKKEIKYNGSLIRASVETESDWEHNLAVVEAQPVKAHISFGEERKEKERLLLELQKEKCVIEHYFNISVNGETKKDLPAVTDKACSALRRLSARIDETQAQASPGDSLDEEHVKELVEQSAQYTITYPKVVSTMEESGYVAKKTGKACVSGKSLKLVDVDFTVDKFVAEV